MPNSQRNGRAARKTGVDGSAATAARAGGVAMAPPAYGIDFVDRAAPAPANRTGLPDALKAGIESLSGLSLDHVRVHYNSSQPAGLDAQAFAQGGHIHLAPGQDHHLPHEVWHVVQQAQGRVKPTFDVRPGAPVNDEVALEQEADAMGARAAAGPAPGRASLPGTRAQATRGAPVAQRVKTILRQGRETEVADDYLLEQGERLPFDARRRGKIDKALGVSRGLMPKPQVGISNRPGLGYDSSVFTLAHNQVQPSSLPPGFEPLPYVPKTDPGFELSQQRAELEKTGVQQARDPRSVKDHLDGVSGLFIPGGQDRDKEGSPEKLTRQAYEQALVREARLRGLPTLAVCGGSRAFVGGFGGSEQALASKAQIKTHDQRTDSQAHGLVFPDRHTLVGSASPQVGRLDKINSTHKKVAATQNGRLTGVPELRGTRRVVNEQGVTLQSPLEPELVVTALDDEHQTPEGFETRYGAPMMGITSHPEAIYRGSTDRQSATPDAQTWSDNLFKGFEQSMRAYGGKQAVNQAIVSGQPAAERARRADPALYAKWRGKRNWQKLRQLGMITEPEAQAIRDEVALHRRQKSDHFRLGRPGRERPDPTG